MMTVHKKIVFVSMVLKPLNCSLMFSDCLFSEANVSLNKIENKIATSAMKVPRKTNVTLQP